jgi:hypothetical protein
MNDRLTLGLWNPVQAHQEIGRVWLWAKAMLMAGHRLQIEVRPEKRSDAENRLLHAMLGHIAKQREWAGKKRDIEVWKRLLTAAWLRARGESIEILPALDGHGIDVVFRRTSDLTRSECADLISYIQAWMADQEIDFPERERIDMETGEITRRAA